MKEGGYFIKISMVKCRLIDTKDTNAWVRENFEKNFFSHDQEWSFFFFLKFWGGLEEWEFWRTIRCFRILRWFQGMWILWKQRQQFWIREKGAAASEQLLPRIWFVTGICNVSVACMLVADLFCGWCVGQTCCDQWGVHFSHHCGHKVFSCTCCGRKSLLVCCFAVRSSAMKTCWLGDLSVCC
jgi:hypothetical protein